MSLSNLPKICTDCTAAGRVGMVIIEHMDVKGKRMFRCRCIYCRKAGEWVADKRLATLSWNKINTVPEI